uniref:Sushi domain-containing protein n=1 Tax=Neogobius melanostomus TaxID=47308 RepID=A0A8C6SCD2_9GOBI
MEQNIKQKKILSWLFTEIYYRSLPFCNKQPTVSKLVCIKSLIIHSLCYSVIAAGNQNCSTPVIENGFFIREGDTLSHDTELYYSCDEDFKTVEGTWWATVTCQNGNWSSIPECDTACFEPEIPNANYTAFQYVKNNEKIRIRCNTGYEDKKNMPMRFVKMDNGQSYPSVKVKMDHWCGPPPQIPNAVIINHGYEEMFQEDAYVEYMCNSNFELETNNNRANCSYGQWLTLPSCRQKQTNQGRDPPATTGAVDILPPNFYKIILLYKCNYYYKLKGKRIVRCANGHWTQPPTCEANFCKLDTSTYPDLENTGDAFIKSGDQMKLPCFDSKWKTARAECRDNQLHLSECKYTQSYKLPCFKIHL